MVISEKAKRYGSDTNAITVFIDEVRKVEKILNELWTKYSNNLNMLGDIYKFLFFKILLL